MVDTRQLDDVLLHEDHKARPDIQYEGPKRLTKSKTAGRALEQWLSGLQT
jgi:hypothetical protein